MCKERNLWNINMSAIYIIFKNKEAVRDVFLPLDVLMLIYMVEFWDDVST